MEAAPSTKMPGLINRMSVTVYERLVENLPDDQSAQVQTIGEKQLAIDEGNVLAAKRIEAGILVNAISLAYPSVDDSIICAIAKTIATEVCAILAYNPPPTEVAEDGTPWRQMVIDAFEAPYIGDADVEFRNYLARCCFSYRNEPKAFSAPCIAIVQSSGFGKSRLVYELAKATAIDMSTFTNGSPPMNPVDMRVLYICARTIPNSSGYPAATPQMRRWLLENSTTSRSAEQITATFKYAQEHWWSIGSEWLGMFTDNGTTDFNTKIALVRANGQEPPRKRTRLSTNRLKALIVVVDETRSLLEEKGECGRNCLEIFRQGLVAANRAIEPGSVIFGVVIDTNPRILLREGSSTQRRASFRPFVLTETMDIFSTSSTGGSITYKASVQTTFVEARSKALVSMARPLWKTFRTYTSVYDQSLITFASRKLLMGVHAFDRRSYCGDTMHGIGVLLCRLGLRVYGRAASILVANCMATLHHVNQTLDELIVSYPSDHVLALGGIEAWYSRDALEEQLLPHFETLVMQGLIGVAKIEEIVGRVFLLLAMDEQFEIRENRFNVRDLSYKFARVNHLLKSLVGEDPLLENATGKEASSLQCEQFNSWMNSWSKWKFCFSHFIELTAPPNEEMLWLLLGRRAAAVLPHGGESNVDLVIPIFCGEQVSAIFIQVEAFSFNLHAPTCFDRVFGESNSLSKLPLQRVVRICMSLHETGEEGQTTQRCMIDSTNSDGDTFVLFLLGIALEKDEGENSWKFISPRVAGLLGRIAALRWWDPLSVAQSDIAYRTKSDDAYFGLSEYASFLTEDTVAETTAALDPVPFDND